MVHFDDNSLMPFGEFKGQKMANVPAARLIWYYENMNLRDPLKGYIENNLETLKAEVKMAKKAKNR